MNRQRIIALLIVITSLIALLPQAAAQETPEGETRDYRIVGYYNYYNIYDHEYFVTDIPAEQLTHLNYAYIDISDNGQCISADRWADTQYSYPGDVASERLRGNFKQLQILKEDHPDLQILMTVGGWEHSANFSLVARTQESRIRFARSCLAFMREYGFDGIDIDWRYPVEGGSSENNYHPDDSENLTLLLAEFRGQIDYWSQHDERQYLLTAVAPPVEELYGYFELEKIHASLDWINVTTYSFQGEWSTVASHHAPLHSNERDPRGETIREYYNVAATVEAYLDAGVPGEKIVIGVPFFAQAWRDVVPNDYFGLYQPAGGVPSGTRPGGILYYRDLIPLLDHPDYVRFFDQETGASWMYSQIERVAISYENPESILYKTAYIRSMGLGGVMVWELAFDDDQNTLLESVRLGLSDN